MIKLRIRSSETYEHSPGGPDYTVVNRTYTIPKHQYRPGKLCRASGKSWSNES